MTTSKLIPDLGGLDRADANLTKLVALLVQGNHHLIDDASLAPPHKHTGVTLRESLGCAL